METTIKGQAWIEKNSLVQEQILIIPGIVEGATNTVVLIEDIWADLTSAAGTYQDNGKGYFYWEYDMTDTGSDSAIVKIKFECPRPKEGLFEEPYDPATVSGDYAKYWVGKLKVATENYEDKAAIQRKEVTFPGSSYISQDGSTIEIETVTVKNTDVGDLTNLINMMYGY